MGHHVQWYQLVVPRYPYGILVVVAYWVLPEALKHLLFGMRVAECAFPLVIYSVRP